MEITLGKWGNSLGIRIPIDILKKLNLVENSRLNISVINNKVILEKPKNELEKLCSAITDENLNKDSDFIDKQGLEW